MEQARPAGRWCGQGCSAFCVGVLSTHDHLFVAYLSCSVQLMHHPACCSLACVYALGACHVLIAPSSSSQLVCLAVVLAFRFQCQATGPAHAAVCCNGCPQDTRVAPLMPLLSCTQLRRLGRDADAANRTLLLKAFRHQAPSLPCHLARESQIRLSWRAAVVVSQVSSYKSPPPGDLLHAALAQLHLGDRAVQLLPPAYGGCWRLYHVPAALCCLFFQAQPKTPLPLSYLGSNAGCIISAAVTGVCMLLSLACCCSCNQAHVSARSTAEGIGACACHGQSCAL